MTALKLLVGFAAVIIGIGLSLLLFVFLSERTSVNVYALAGAVALTISCFILGFVIARKNSF
ncbi:MAG: hypothetical protein Q8891_09080 [Bacteroidota bacterium]|nr:hypothetical protein [Bacteroidota bacterium]